MKIMVNKSIKFILIFFYAIITLVMKMLYTSVENKKIKEIKKLNNKKYRKETGLFIIESEHLINEAYKNGNLKELILLENIEYKLDIETNYVNEKVMKYITELDTIPTMIGICNKIKEKELGNKILMLDGIQDPGNLGTIIRSSVAFNVDTIILGNNTVDLYNSKVLRASEGMIFNINIIEKNLLEFVPVLKENNYKIIGTKVTNGKDIKNIEKNEKICIIMGNEGNGINNELLEICDDYIYIKMSDKCESLNVGIATSIILYELDK